MVPAAWSLRRRASRRANVCKVSLGRCEEWHIGSKGHHLSGDLCLLGTVRVCDPFHRLKSPLAPKVGQTLLGLNQHGLRHSNGTVVGLPSCLSRAGPGGTVAAGESEGYKAHLVPFEVAPVLTSPPHHPSPTRTLLDDKLMSVGTARWSRAHISKQASSLSLLLSLTGPLDVVVSANPWAATQSETLHPREATALEFRIILRAFLLTPIERSASEGACHGVRRSHRKVSFGDTTGPGSYITEHSPAVRTPRQDANVGPLTALLHLRNRFGLLDRAGVVVVTDEQFQLGRQ